MKTILFSLSHMEYTIELAESLSKFVDLKLMIPKQQLKLFNDVMNDNIDIYFYNKPKLRYPINIIIIFNILSQIIRFKPDVIHLQGEHPWLDLTLPFLRFKYPIVITVHDVILHSGDKLSSKFPSFMYKLNRMCANQVIVHGKKLKEEMIKKYNTYANNIHILPRGINSIYNRYEQYIAQEENLILFFGRIWEYKGLQYLIEAEPFITESLPTAKIIIAGTGEDFQKYKNLMKHPENFIIYNTYISNQLVNELFQKASIVVLPYIDASQSAVVPLAYAFKKPVVVTNVGSLPEVVEHGKTGYIVPARDSKKLAEAILDLLKNDEKRKKMGENAYKKANKDLSWDIIARQTFEVYKKAISEKNISKKLGRLNAIR